MINDEFTKEYPTRLHKSKFKDKLLEIKKYIFILEIFTSFVMFVAVFTELGISTKMLSYHFDVSTKYYYRIIEYTSKGLDFIYDLKITSKEINPNDNSTEQKDNITTPLKLANIEKIIGICLYYDKENNFYLNMTQKEKGCYSKELKFNKPEVLNFWDDYYYYVNSYKVSDIKLYFQLNTNKCEKDDLMCGNIHNYIICIKNKIEKKCPYFGIYKSTNETDDSIKLKNKDYKFDIFWFGKSRYIFLRNITDEYRILNSMIKLEYGNKNSISNDVLEQTYYDFQSLRYYDLNNTNRISIFNQITDLDNNNFFKTQFKNSIIKKTNNSFPILSVYEDIPGDFYISRLDVQLPKDYCFVQFLNEMNSSSNDYFTKIKFDLNFLNITIYRYVTWCVIQFSFYFLFIIYFRGYVIYSFIFTKETKKKIEKDTISEITKIILQTLILSIKLFISLIQKKFVSEIKDFISKYVFHNCYENDSLMTEIFNKFNSYIDDLVLKTDLFINLSITLLIFSLLSIITIIYFEYKNNEYIAIYNDYKIGKELNLQRQKELSRQKKSIYN